MPKTKEEKETLKQFGKEYKDPKKAKEVYYALRNKDKKFDRSQGGGFSDKAEEIMKKDESIKQSRSEYPANEEGFTTSMGPADLSKFAAASRKSSPLWWAVRLNKLPEAIKAKIIKSLNITPAVAWWNDRIETLTNHLGNEEDDKEDHTR